MDIGAQTLPLLVSLSAMLEEKNITRAASRLGISQPALSAQLARLRDIFDDQLLTPAASGKGMVLTPRASMLKDPLKSALQHLEDVVGVPAAFDPAQSDRTFTIGANDNATAIIGAQLIARLRSQGFTGVRLSFRVVDFTRLPGQLETGEIHIALVSRSKALPASFATQTLLDEEFRMAQRKGHPRGDRPPSIEEYAALEHVLVSGDGGGFRGFIDDALERQGLARRVGVSVQYYGVVPLMLQTTDLVSTLPSRFLHRYANSLTSFPLPIEVQRFVLNATWHQRFDREPGHLWLRQQLALCVQA